MFVTHSCPKLHEAIDLQEQQSVTEEGNQEEAFASQARRLLLAVPSQCVVGLGMLVGGLLVRLVGRVSVEEEVRSCELNSTVNEAWYATGLQEHGCASEGTKDF